METASKKRKGAPDDRDKSSQIKRPRGKKQWDGARHGGVDPRAIQPGDTGVWATCAMKKEAKTVADLRDLFQEYAIKIYGPEQTDGGTADEASATEEDDIEAEISKELAEILVFFRTRLPVEPVSFVEKICQDLAAGVQVRNCRYVKRLTPITSTEKASAKGLEDVAKRVLAPHFHQKDQTGKKFAIRPSIRNNKELTRDAVIKTVAAIVGPGHKVDLRNYDHLILVEIYKNVVGMSVVGPDFEELKRFNLEELRQPLPSNDANCKSSSKLKISEDE
ncbi:hypothetical protein ACEQ8H_000915 [Pleosporales sp. CAS-2024a]